MPSRRYPTEFSGSDKAGSAVGFLIRREKASYEHIKSGNLVLAYAGIEGFVDAEAGANSKQHVSGEIVV